jgi:hypothetical protein
MTPHYGPSCGILRQSVGANAAKLLTNRLSPVFFRSGLVDTLGKLPDEKADFLASLIVERLHSMQTGRTREAGLSILCKAISYVGNRDALRARLSKEASPEERASTAMPGMVLTALAVRQLAERSATSREANLLKQFRQAISWGMLNTSYALLMASAIPTFIYIQPSMAYPSDTADFQSRASCALCRPKYLQFSLGVVSGPVDPAIWVCVDCRGRNDVCLGGDSDGKCFPHGGIS